MQNLTSSIVEMQYEKKMYKFFFGFFLAIFLIASYTLAYILGKDAGVKQAYEELKSAKIQIDPIDSAFGASHTQWNAFKQNQEKNIPQNLENASTIEKLPKNSTSAISENSSQIFQNSTIGTSEKSSKIPPILLEASPVTWIISPWEMPEQSSIEPTHCIFENGVKKCLP